MGLFAALEPKLKWSKPREPWQRWLPVCGFVVGLPLWILDVVYGQDFPWALLVIAAYVIVGGMVVGVAAMNWRHWKYALSTAIIFLGVSWVVEANAYTIYANSRWWLTSKEYKAEVFAEPAPPPGELQNLDWGGWGMAGQDTEVYLAFDPDNSLSNAAKHNLSGKIAGVPCPVWQVHRLQDRWYFVVMYTNTIWDQCD